MKRLLLVAFTLFNCLISYAQIINTVAGGTGDGGPAINTPLPSALDKPIGIAIDASGNLYIASKQNSRIRKVNLSTGIISTVAGNGIQGFGGDGGLATDANLYEPSGLALDALGNLYIADSHNNRIRKVDANTGIISTVAGDGSYSFGGDGGLATNASLYNPLGITIDAFGNFYIADTDNNRIRKVNAITGIITTVAGGSATSGLGDGGLATNARLSTPSSVTFDASGNLYIADKGNERIRKVNISTGVISTVVGSGFNLGDGGLATVANLYSPTCVAFDASGNLYIADYWHHRIRKVTTSTGIISTVAGNGNQGFGGDGGSATAANLNFPTGVAVDASGNLYIADQNNRIRKVNAVTGIISTVAGNGFTTYGGDGGIATLASLYEPYDAVIDSLGNLYISDFGNNRIRKVSAGTNIITTIAGDGNNAYGGDGGAATEASLNGPEGITIDGLGNIYFADETNHRIRKVNSSTGIITTVAGNGTANCVGDGGTAIAAGLDKPCDVVLDATGNLFIADKQCACIRKVNVSTGIISRVAGGGLGGDGVLAINASLKVPTGVAVDASGNFYIADQSDHRIRKVNANTGIISTIAGNGTQGFSGDGGPAIAAKLSKPSGISIDGLGNLYIADFANYRIRKVNASTGIISTVAGNGISGFGGDGGEAITANLISYSVSLDTSGSLYIPDYFNDRIRKVSSVILNNTINNSQNICLGSLPDSIMGSTPNGSGFGYTYSWIKSTTSNSTGFTSIASSNFLNYKPSALTQSTWFKRVVISGNLKDTSAAVLISVSNPITNNTINSSSQTICYGLIPSTISASNPGGGDDSNYNYTWLGSTTNATSGYSAISSSNFKNYLPSALTQNTWFKRVVSSGVCGSDTSIAYLISVNPKPSVGFAVNTANQCLKTNSYSFVDTSKTSSGTIISRLWTLGNGDTTSIINPNKVFINAGTYNIKLLIINDNGCKDSLAKTVIIYPNTTVGFKINNSIQCVNNSYLFTDTSTISSGTFTRLWDFGDASIGTTNPFTKTYSIANSYQVKLVTTSNFGCIDSISKTVVVNPKPTVGFTTNFTNQCLNTNSYSFADTSKIASGTLSRLWTLGNEDTTSIINPSKIFSNAGTYNIKLLTTSDLGCKDSLTKTIIIYPNTTIGFKVNNSSQCLNGNSFLYTDTSSLSSGTYTRVWNFGDFTNSTANLFTKTYYNASTYQVKLVSTTNNGCKDSLTKSVRVYPKPDVYFMNTNPNQCLKGNLFSFPDSSFIGSGSLTRTWYLGDGSIDTNLIINKSFAQAKTYQVKLVVTSNNACKDSMISEVIVYPQPNSMATALDNTSICQGKTSIIKANTGIGYAYQWLNNNAEINNAKDSIITVSMQGNYSVITSNTFGCSDTSNVVSILVNPIPKPGFLINNPSQCLNGNSFTFSDTSNAALRLWTLANGNVDTNRVITNSITSAGIYTIKLRIVSDKFCMDSILKNITVNPNPIVGNIQGATNVGMASPYTYSITSQANHTYLWNVTNGNILSGQGTNSVQVQWLSVGTGKIQVQLINNQNCSSTDSSLVSISNVGIHELQSLSQLELYPNPNNGDFTLKITSAKASETRISLLNMLGQEVWADTKTFNSGIQELFLTTDVAAGVYLLRVQNEDGHMQKSVVIR